MNFNSMATPKQYSLKDLNVIVNQLKKQVATSSQATLSNQQEQQNTVKAQYNSLPESTRMILAPKGQYTQSQIGDAYYAEKPERERQWALVKEKLPEIEREIDTQIAKVDSTYNANKAKWDNERRRNTYNGSFGMGFAQPTQFRNSATSEDQKKLDAARIELSRAKKAINTYTEADQSEDKGTDREKGKIKQFIDGFRNVSIDDVVNIGTLGYAGSVTDSKINSVLAKAERGEQLNEIEQLIVDSRQSTQNAKGYVASRGGGTIASSIGGGVLQSTGFMVETAATGRMLDVVRTATSKGVKLALKAAGREALRTPLRGSMMSNYQERTADQYSIADDGSVIKDNPTAFLERMYKSYATTYAEGLSEQMGNVVGGKVLSSGLKKIAPKMLGANIGTSVVDGVNWLDLNTKGFRDVLKKSTGYNGTINEFLEEEFSNVVEPLLTFEPERIKDNFTLKNQFITLGSVAVIGGTTHVMSTPGIVTSEIKTSSLRKQRNTAISEIKDETLRQGVYDAIKKGATIEDKSKLLADLDWSTGSSEDIAHAADALSWSLQADIFRGFDDSQQAEALASLKAEEYSRFFKENMNSNSGMVHEVYDADENPYYLLSGDLDQDNVDGTIFVKNAQTGQIEQISRNDIVRSTNPISYERGLSEVVELTTSEIMEQTLNQDQEQDIEDAALVGVQPISYKMDDKVVLSDGREAVFIGYLNDGSSMADVAVFDPETSDYTTQTIPKSQIISLSTAIESENAGNPEPGVQLNNELEESPVESHQREIPLTKDGKPDYDSMPVDMFVEEASRVYPREKVFGYLEKRLSKINKRVESLAKKEPDGFNAMIAWESTIEDLKQQAREIEAAITANTVHSDVKVESEPKVSRSNQVGSQITDKYVNAPKEYGVEKSIITANDESIKGRYVLLESGSVTASHDPQTFAQSAGFPVNESGSTVNDRDYGKDKDAQQSVVLMAQKYNGRAIDNPVIVSPDGVVVSGNNRTMSGELAARMGTDKAYIDHLKENAAQFGFTEDQISKLEHPRIVFQTTEPQLYNTETFAKFNAQDTKSQNKVEKAIKFSKTVSDATIRRIGSEVEDHDTLGDLYADTRSVSRLIKVLQDSGVINQNEVAELKDGDNLSAIGKDMFETVLVGSVLSENTIRLVNQDGMKRYRGRITKAIVPLLDNLTLGDYGITNEVDLAVSLLDLARRGKSSIDDALSMKDMFQETPYTPLTVALAKSIEGSDKGIKELISQYNSLATSAAHGQVDMFTQGVKRQDQILKEMGLIPSPETDTNSAADPIASAVSPQEKHRAVVRHVEKLNKLSGADAVAFSELGELKQNIADMFASQWANDPQTETPGVTIGLEVYIYSPHIKSVKDLTEVYTHEVVAHRNILVALGKDRQAEKMLYSSIVDEIGISEMTKYVSDGYFVNLVDNYFNNPTKNNKVEVGKEFVAYYAQNNFNEKWFNLEGNGKFVLNLLDGIDLSHVDQIITTANNGADGQKIFIRNSSDRNGEVSLEANNSRNLGQIGTGDRVDITRGGSDRILASENPSDSVSGISENTTYPENRRGITTESLTDNLFSTPRGNTGPDQRVESRFGSKPISGNDVERDVSSTAKQRLGEGNTIVSADRIEELRKRAKEKLSQLNSGFDPELYAVLTELSVGYIEAGVRKFADFTTSMVAEFGDKVKPYLTSMYEGARRFPGMEQIAKEMDITIYVDNYTQELKENGRKRNSRVSDPISTVIPDMAFSQQLGVASSDVQSENAEGLPERKSTGTVRSKARVSKRGNVESASIGDSNKSDVPNGRVGEFRLEQQAEDGTTGSDSQPHAVLQRNGRNFRITDTSQSIVPNGEIAKIKANIEAVKLLKELQKANRDATTDEQKKLSQYSGWGGLSTVLATNRTLNSWIDKYGKYNAELKELLSKDEYTAAVNSTINAHYTTPQIISNIWSAVSRLGFNGGTILEPAMGSGNFFGAMPSEISENSRLIGYELDAITGAIADKLYPDATVKVAGYETASEGPASVDLVISNVPFGQSAPYDPKHKDISKFSLHNYFIAKGLRQLRDGGLGVFITSSSTMDGGSSRKFREWTQSEGNADFIGAVRLPNTAFAANAGTTVTTDILFYRKRNGISRSGYEQPYRNLSTIREVKRENQYNNKTRKYEDVVLPLQVNEYFATNPDMMLGDMHFAFEIGNGGLYSDTDQTLQAKKGEQLQERLRAALDTLPSDIYGSDEAISGEVIAANEREVISTFVKRDGEVYEVTESGLDAICGTTKIGKKIYQNSEITSSFIDIKQAAQRLITLEQNSYDNVEIEAQRKELNRLYDNFNKRYGNFNRNNSVSFLQDDIQHVIAYALENVTEENYLSTGGKTLTKFTVTKADILSKRISNPLELPGSAASVADAVQLSLRFKGSVDIPYLASLLGVDQDSAKTMLLDSSEAFINPSTGKIEERSEYLSGFVKDKLEVARQYAKTDPKYEINISELKRVIPTDIAPSDVNFRMSSYWLPSEFAEAFFKEQFGVTAYIKYVLELGEWVVNAGKYSSKNGKTAGFYDSELAEKVLNQRPVTVYKTVGDKKVKDIEGSAEAAARMSEINDNFIEFVSNNDSYMETIARIYNEKFNTFVKRKFQADGGYYPGASRSIKLRQHQSNAVQRILNDSVLLAHEVGTGKTFTMITGAMEMRRLGIARKPMIVVQNSTLEQFAASFQQLYPAAKLLVPSEKQRSAEKRQRLFAMIAYGDFDAVIIPQSFVDFIADDPKRIADKLQDELDNITNLAEATTDYALKNELRKKSKSLEDEIEKISTPTVKDVAKKQLSIEKRMKRQADRKTDKVFTFEELGVDALFVDEAHAYKKLGFNTSMGNVKGIDTGVSKRAFSMKLKADWIQSRAGGRNVVFATGTPITNTMAEAWTMMRFISPDLLKRYGIVNFDAFASTFGIVETGYEFNASGNFKQIERFKSFMNAPEFINIFKGKTDVVLSRDIPGFAEKLPKLLGGGFTQRIIKRSGELTDFMNIVKDELAAWAKLPKKNRSPATPMVMFTRASQAAIDLRLIDPNAIDSDFSKTNEVVRNVKRIYDKTSSYNGSQMVFSDKYQSPDYSTSTAEFSVYSNPSEGANRFNLYEDMRSKLIDMGVTSSEIAIVTDMDAKKKEQLFARVNSGEVRIVFGSTEKMGVGVNAQRLLAAVHHIDAPARPMDFTQRNGRIIRQGNLHSSMNLPVEVLTYGVEKTLDVTAYQRLATKQAFIDQILGGDVSSRIIDDEADEGSVTGQSFEEMMSNLSGSQYALRLTELNGKLRKAEMAVRSAERSRSDLKQRLYINRQKVVPIKMELVKLKKSIEAANELFGDSGKVTKVTIGRGSYTEKLSDVISKTMMAFADSYRKNRNAEPLRLTINDNPRQMVIMYNQALDQFSYIMNIEDMEIKGEVGTGGGLMVSVTSKIKALQKLYADKYIELKDIEESIPSLEKRLGEPNKNEIAVIDLKAEIAAVTKLMADESAAEEISNATELNLDNDIRYRDLSDINQTFNDELQQLIDGSLGAGHVFSFGMPSDALLLSGVPKLPIELSATRLKAKSEQDNHKFDLSNVVNLPDAIANPIAVFDSTKGETTKVILTELSNGKDNFVVVLSTHSKGTGRKTLEISNIVSLYPKDHFQGIIDWISGGLMRWVDKEKALNFISVQWPNYIGNGDKTKGFNSATKIIENFENPKYNVRNRIEDNSIKEAAKQREYEAQKQRKYISPDKRKVEAIDQLRKLAQRFKTEVVIVDSVRELPDNLRYATRNKRFKGLYRKSSSEVYFIASEIKDTDDATAIFLHEVVAHKGIDGLMGREKADQFYTAVFESQKPHEQTALLAKYGDKVVAGDELVARMAEGDVTPSVMQSIVSAIRRFFRETLGMPLTITDNDIRYLLWKSKNNLQRATTVSEVFSVIERDMELEKQLYPAEKSLMEQIKEVSIRYRDGEKQKGTVYRVSGKKSSFKSKAIQVQEGFQDSTIKVHLTQNEIKRRGGTITPMTNVYEALNHRDSIADAQMEKYSHNFIRPIINDIKQFRSKGIGYGDVTEYMLAKHSLERHNDHSDVTALAEEGKGDWTESHVSGIITNFESKLSEEELTEFWNIWRDATRRILDIAVESGRMSLQQRNDILAKKWEYYVPLRGKDWDFEKMEDLRDVFYTQYSNRGNGVSSSKEVLNIKARGRRSKASDPIAALQQMANLEIYLSAVNNVNRSLLRLAEQYSDMKDIFESIDNRWFVKVGLEWRETNLKPDIAQIKASNEAQKLKRSLEKELAKETEAKKAETLRAQIEQADNDITVSARSINKPYTGLDPSNGDVVVMKDGVRYIVRLADVEVAAAINGNSGSVQRWLSRYPGRVTRVMSQLSTSKNPAFILPNFIRDLQQATLYSYVDSNGHTLDLLKYTALSWGVLHRSTRGKLQPLTVVQLGELDILDPKQRKTLIGKYGKKRVEDTLYDIFHLNGGETGYVHILEPKDYQRKLRKEIMYSTGRNYPLKFVKGVNNGLDYMANMSENMVRFATFMSQIDNGSNAFDAVSYAKNITVNFNRKGKYSKGVGALFMFFNAGIQGALNFYSLYGNKQGKSKDEIRRQRVRFLKANAVLASLGYVSAMFMYEMLLGLAGDDGEEFQVSEYERRTNLIIPAVWSDKGYVKIPIPIIFRPFYALGVMSNDWVNGKIEPNDILASFTEMMVDAVSPQPVEFSLDQDNGWSWTKSIVPSAIKPIAEIGYNQNFMGAKINREAPYSPNTPESQLGRANTNSMAVSISKWLNELGGGNAFTPAGISENGKRDIRNLLDISPSTIEHIATSYTGGVGRIIHEAYITLTSSEKEARKIPVLNRFYGEAYPKDPSKEYYDIKRNIEWVDNNNKATEKNKVESALFGKGEFSGKKLEYKKYREMLKSVEKRIKAIEERLKESQFGTHEYDNLESQIDNLQRQFIKQYNDQRN